ncbi:MAG: DNA primase [Porticoccaceae bacterium]|nr:DNA primase [Porticoccaceae bacterium]
MSGLIPQSFIDDLLDRTDIVEIIGSRVEIKKAGKNHKACCPFHEEKSPSFTVAQDKQFYYCFGCGAGGNALSFIMEFDRVDFLPAVEALARQLGVDIPREPVPERSAVRNKDNIYSILGDSDRYYRQQLRQHPSAKTAVSYLKERGLSGQIAAQFGIGYAPPGWDNLMQAEAKDKDRTELLKESGMLVSKPEENKQYDRFRHRIMFPIRDQRGRTVGFGGRVLDDSKPKYLNSPETPVFQKGRELYGLYEARQALKEIPRLIMVEGYMDVIALAQYGIQNAVATLGTALTDGHLQKIFRYTSEIVFCFDGDAAGRKAAARALVIALPEMRDGVSARFLFLPDSEDPDSSVRKLGHDAFIKTIENSQPLSEFFFVHLSSDIDTSTADGKAKLGKLCAPQISRIPEGIFRQLMLAELAQRTGLSTADLRTYVAAHKPKPSVKILTSEPSRSMTSNEPPEYSYEECYPPPEHHDDSSYPQLYGRVQKIRTTPIQHLCALLLNHPDLAQHIDDSALLASSLDPEIQLFMRLLTAVQQHPNYKSAQLLAYWLGNPSAQEEARHLQSLASREIYHPPPGTGRDDHAEFCDALAHVQLRVFEALPDTEKARHLLDRETLNEREIKQLHKIHVKLPHDEQGKQLKNHIKQRLVLSVVKKK